ncbi:MAG: hypothetical protein COX19_03450 [Desulfobacterales bacterium CG23_combo_of_CG06-09_8_20_14_all_51_8]|nr:MAG: hypothetical protein COX19_03450 [Desulfobacterales bacterium CG23_combo_of_CG06-09_8_20_14_all_51_8]
MDAATHAGAAALPYFVYGKTSLQDLDAALKNADAPVRLSDTYPAVYHHSLEEAPAHKEEAPAFDSMETATRHLRQILKSKGVSDAENYLITAIDTAVSDGFILTAAIYRPDKTISVFNKFNFLARQTLSPADPEFFRAYRVDVSGDPQDIIYDWAALPTDCIACRECQAVFLTLTANKILEKQAKDDFWPQERQWIAGNHLSVLIRQDMMVSQALGIEKGFTQNLKISKN